MKQSAHCNVYNVVMLRWLLVAAVMSLLIACERELPPEHETELAAAIPIKHPWDNPGWINPAAQQIAAIQANRMGNDVAASAERGPAFAVEDTLNPAALSGNWQLVLTTNGSQYTKLTPGSMSQMELLDTGSLRFHSFYDGDLLQSLEGNWKKSAPGRLLMEVTDNSPVESYAQMFGQDFLFLWTYEPKNGMWFVREQEGSTVQVEYNRFDTTRGELVMTPIQQSWEGQVTSDGEVLECTGFYHNGILSCEWRNVELGTRGFAAFRVAPDWSGFQGVWWLAGAEVAPFGQAWDGTAIR